MLGVSRHEGSANTMVTIVGQAGVLTKASLRGVTSMWTVFWTLSYIDFVMLL